MGLFNAVNLELARGIISAAESRRAPVIMGTAEVLFPYGPLEEVSYYLLPMAKKASVPVVIHLDHGLKKETCLKALELGFSSIMYDCSTDPYDVNVKKVKEMAEIARSVSVPLVLHGGSGLTDNDFRQAIREGISKVNIFTDINVAAVEAEFQRFSSMNKGIIDLIPAAVEAVKQETMKKIDLFGSGGKADNGMNAGGTGTVDVELLTKLVADEVKKHLKK